MRLLQFSEDDELRIQQYDDDKLPPYAILSHTWGADDEEVTLDDLKHGRGRCKPGYAKILFCGQQAKQDDLNHFWVDSCCIDKPNFTELSEAINSMFRWYQQAAKCYVYLQDVTALKRDSDRQACDWRHAFRKSRWFTRGWTLQELLAPKIVEFWSRDRQKLGAKENLANIIAEITDIPVAAILGAPLSGFTVNERLRWVAKRDTKKREDRAYCLFGIFNVFLPLIYGEGENALTRLQGELNKSRTLHGSSTEYLNENGNGSVDERQKARKTLLESLTFDQMDSRHSTIKEAQRSTCEWILQNPLYTSWKEQYQPLRHQGVLWIAGKPGAGKSTLMKFALSHALKNKADDEVVLSFFFNARGEELEKTTLGMYRSILAQLLHAAPDLRDILDGIAPADTTWTLDRLQSLLSAAVSRLGRRGLRIFIDALDECNEQQVRDMIEFLEDLGEHVLPGHSRLHTCFASRHYPIIVVTSRWRLVLEDEAGHAEDLKKYVLRRLQVGKGKLVTEVQDQIQEKANGVFMWVVLVVNILNEEFRRGRIFGVKQRLKEIPTGLSNLFRDLLRRDSVNLDDLLLCLQWILFAKRPLSREEFYFAMVAGLNCHADSRPEPWDPEETSTEDMTRFLLNSSKGLAELTRSKSHPKVQFIHESVRNYLLEDGGLRDLWPKFDNQLVSLSHDRLKKCCSYYLTADTSNYVNPEKELGAPASSSKRTVVKYCPELFDAYPFLRYAVTGVLHHANEAAASEPQDAFLEDFAIQKWVQLQNSSEKHEIRRYTAGVNLSYLFADLNLASLLCSLQDKRAWLRIPNERYQCAVLAAFFNGHRNALSMLLGQHGIAFEKEIFQDSQYGKPIIVSLKRDPNILRWLHRKGLRGLFKSLLVSLLDTSMEPELLLDDVDVLPAAVLSGLPDLVQSILERGLSPNVESNSYGVPLLKASTDGNEQIVELLVQSGADVNATASMRVTALQCASRNGHHKVVDVLLRYGANVDALDGDSNTALHSACTNGHEKVVDALLRNGANVDALDGDSNTALHSACTNGHDKVVDVLLGYGANVDALDGDSKTALHCASKHEYDKVLNVLLRNGANANALDGDSNTALHSACTNGHDKVVDVLLRYGANVDALDGDSNTALHIASNCGRSESVRLLLDRGANVNHSSPRDNRTALHAVCGLLNHGSVLIAQLLVDRGADVNAVDVQSHTALHLLCSKFVTCPETPSVAKILIDGGADVDALDWQSRTALHLLCSTPKCHCVSSVAKVLIDGGAVVNALDMQSRTALHLLFSDDQHINAPSIAKALIDGGADVDAADKESCTALHYACMKIHEPVAMVKLLLDAGADGDALCYRRGSTVAQSALQLVFEGYEPIWDMRLYGRDERIRMARMLLDHGVNPHLGEWKREHEALELLGLTRWSDYVPQRSNRDN